MSSKTNKDFTSFTGINFATEIGKILDEYKTEVNNLSEDALDEASDYLVIQLEKAAPLGKGSNGIHLKNSFVSTQRKYRHVRYVGTTRVNQDGVPLLAIIEYSITKGSPFVIKTFKKNKKKILSILEGGINNAKRNKSN